MNQPSSSIFNSDVSTTAEPVASPVSAPRRKSEARLVAEIGIWIVIWLMLIDVVINVAFAYPSRAQASTPGALAAYFDYGRSIEGKIRRLVGPTNDLSSPRALDGWLPIRPTRELITRRRAGATPSVSIYGMSFSNQIAETLAEAEPEFEVRRVSAPSAPPNHSYTAYLLDGGGRSDVVVLSILASSIQGMASNNGMTWRFEGPSPYTFPRYQLEDSGLGVQWPSVLSLDDLRNVMSDAERWKAYMEELQRSDECYRSFLFRQDLSDASALLRLIRRALGQRHQEFLAHRIHDSAGFHLASNEIQVLNRMVDAFASDARKQEKLPVILLLHNRGYADHLYLALKGILDRDNIPFVSTHTICPANDIRNFEPDNHFTKEANIKIARELSLTIRRSLSRSFRGSTARTGVDTRGSSVE
jgi:hypothetical protein